MWCADAHKIARFVGWEDVVDYFNHAVHDVGGFADGKAADGTARGGSLGDIIGRLFSKVLVLTPLDDGK